jgi:hypothetical protein
LAVIIILCIIFCKTQRNIKEAVKSFKKNKAVSINNSFKTVLSICGLTLLFLIAIECSARLALHIRTTILANRSKPISTSITNYPRDFRWQQNDWFSTYYKEHLEAKAVQWHSYVYWRRKPFKGQYVNVDKRGVRQTTNPKLQSGEKTLKVFVFGGSTLWGRNARDDYTIPSLLSKHLNQKLDTKVQVTNFGEIGFVNTQEIIQLLLELQRKNIPEVVVFYDGVNDVFSAYQNGVAGIPQNEDNRRYEFNTLKPMLNDPKSKDKIYKSAISLFVRHSAIFRIIKKIASAITSHEPLSRSPAWKRRARARSFENQLIDEVLLVYQANMKIIEALAKSYGFKSRFYWQPQLFSKRKVTPYELKHLEGAEHEYPSLREFFQKAYSRVRQSDFFTRKRNFHDISLIFDECRTSLYSDLFHQGENANRVIAKRIAQDILESLPQDAGDRQDRNEKD